MQVRIDHSRWGAPAILSEQRLRVLARRTLRIAAPRLQVTELSVVFVSARRSRLLNRQYRNRSRVADVLSFPLGGIPGRTRSLLGEIFLCPEALRRRTKESGRTLVQETTALFVHGLLHLLGFDHHTQSAYRRMRRLEEKIL